MKILEVKALEIPDVKVIRYARFADHRGYFGEHYRKSDFSAHPQLGCMQGVEFLQCNESRSQAGTVRGLHLQWNPFMAKLVRTLRGRMVDIVLDVRKGSPTFGKALCYDMPDTYAADFGEWIWVPVGCAHGNYYPEESQIEYFCSGEYSPGCEAGISPFSPDIDWRLCRPELKRELDAMLAGNPLIADKDRNGFSLASWIVNPNADRFTWQSA